MGASSDNMHQVINLETLLKFEGLKGEEDNIKKAYHQLISHTITEADQIHLKMVMETALILLEDLNLGPQSVQSVMLKNLCDQGVYTYDSIEAEYSQPVRQLIEGINKLEHLDTKKYRTNTENFIRLFLTLSPDIRIILIRLGMRIYDIRHLPEYPDEKQQQILGETKAMFIPIAHRLGLYQIKKELEDQVMRFIDQQTYDLIRNKLTDTQTDRDLYTADFIRPISQKLKENGFDCDIKSRVKSIPSIYRKMQAQKVEFEKVYDLFAIRIIINQTLESEVSDCWKIYSLVTDIYTPNPRRLRDWISFPKPTGYESLHTTVIGPDRRWVEVQIRTRRMDEIAEKGFAAHWKYKSQGKSIPPSDLFKEIRELLEKPVNSTLEKSISNEKSALYTDEIFIFTPQGDLKRLKTGYSVLDFAYEIHTDIGASCSGAIVNGKMVPLKYILQNGDTVKILTSKTQKPNPGWLEIVKSPRNLARVKHALKMELYKEADFGKEILKNKVTQNGFEFTDPIINKLVDYFDCNNILDLYQRFGSGKLDPAKIKKALTATKEETLITTPVKEESFPERLSGVMAGDKDFVIIDPKIRSLHYEFAKCCKPVIGNPIFAFVSVSQGIKIHQTNCPNARQLITRYPYRVLEARWKGGD
ncbi:MAG: TGS domain-containing protein [Bacteroidales bacterium]|nr:TGS domain-containing protein [Bacteroidales bacterium]